jgi:hypothetical protein
VKIKYVTAAIILALAFTMVATGQRRNKRPRPKPAPQAAQPEAEPDALTLLYSEYGRNYYLFEVVKHPATNDLYYTYVVIFDKSTPSGRSALTKAIALARVIAVDVDQTYYVTALQYQCHFPLDDPSNLKYDVVLWADSNGNPIAQSPISAEESTDMQGQVSEIATYNEPYLQNLLEVFEQSSEAERANWESKIQLLISEGREDEARRLKFTPRMRKGMPALSLYFAGGSKHIAEIKKAAIAAYEKKIGLLPSRKN